MNVKVFTPEKKIFEIKNGKGKINYYYPNKKLKFEGELVNGEKNGKFIKYDFNSKIVFVGEYLFGLKNGKCIEYYQKGQLKFKYEVYSQKDIYKKIHIINTMIHSLMKKIIVSFSNRIVLFLYKYHFYQNLNLWIYYFLNFLQLFVPLNSDFLHIKWWRNLQIIP